MHAVYEVVAAFNGSISAEHGLGQSKHRAAALYKDAVELNLMKSIKRLLDPRRLMNPGKVFVP
ncbi:hypothetical protein GCM10027514_18680 [Azotobacter armeniacus]